MHPIGSVRIVQTHDAHGRPAPATYVQPLATSTSTELAVAELLAPLDPRPTDRPDVYTYRDQQRGSGRRELVGFTRGDLERAADALLMERVEAEVGELAPFRNEDVHRLPAVYGSMNPWLWVVFGAALMGLALFAAYRLLAAVGALMAVAGCVLALALLGLGAWMLVTGIRRVRWWHAARATARRLAGRIPTRLQG